MDNAASFSGQRIDLVAQALVVVFNSADFSCNGFVELIKFGVQVHDTVCKHLHHILLLRFLTHLDLHFLVIRFTDVMLFTIVVSCLSAKNIRFLDLLNLSGFLKNLAHYFGFVIMRLCNQVSGWSCTHIIRGILNSLMSDFDFVILLPFNQRAKWGLDLFSSDRSVVHGTHLASIFEQGTVTRRICLHPGCRILSVAVFVAKSWLLLAFLFSRRHGHCLSYGFFCFMSVTIARSEGCTSCQSLIRLQRSIPVARSTLRPLLMVNLWLVNGTVLLSCKSVAARELFIAAGVQILLTATGSGWSFGGSLQVLR